MRCNACTAFLEQRVPPGRCTNARDLTDWIARTTISRLLWLSLCLGRACRHRTAGLSYRPGGADAAAWAEVVDWWKRGRPGSDAILGDRAVRARACQLQGAYHQPMRRSTVATVCWRRPDGGDGDGQRHSERENITATGTANGTANGESITAPAYKTGRVIRGMHDRRKHPVGAARAYYHGCYFYHEASCPGEKRSAVGAGTRLATHDLPRLGLLRRWRRRLCSRPAARRRRRHRGRQEDCGADRGHGGAARRLKLPPGSPSPTSTTSTRGSRLRKSMFGKSGACLHGELPACACRVLEQDRQTDRQV